VKDETAERYQILNKFGPIELLEYVIKDQKPINIAYVTFEDPDSARKCVDAKIIHSHGDLNVYAHFSKPNFTKNMLIKLNPKIRQYIKDVQKRKITYNPVQFSKLYDEIINNGEYAYNPTKDKKFENPDNTNQAKGKKSDNNKKPKLKNKTGSHDLITEVNNSSINNGIVKNNMMEYNPIEYSKNDLVEANANGYCNPTGPYNSDTHNYYGYQSQNSEYYGYDNRVNHNTDLTHCKNNYNYYCSESNYYEPPSDNTYNLDEQKNLQSKNFN